MATIDKEPIPSESNRMRPLTLGEAAMASVGMDYANYPVADEIGVRVPIYHHPEIIAYQIRGNHANTRDVDDLITLDRAVRAEQAPETTEL